MRYGIKSFCFTLFGLVMSAALGQNPNYSAYYTYSVTFNADGSATVTPTAEVTGTDDAADWVEGQWRPVCNVYPKIQLTGDPSWVHGTGRGLGQLIDYVRTGNPVQIPANGSTVNVQFAVEADVRCSKPPTTIYYEYPSSSLLSTWDGIDPNTWLLVGFEPAQTNPPWTDQSCPSPETCPVGYGVASVPNFVDFADFVSWPISVAVTYGKKVSQTTDPKDGDPIGIYSPYCSGNTVAICPLTATWRMEYGPNEVPYSVVVTDFLAFKWKGVVVSCIANPEVQPAGGPGPCR
jgi:hypothetical protein